MGEHHEIAGPARGEPRSTGATGARVRVPLDAPPSPRWSHALTANLAQELAGDRCVGHLRLNEVVQGAEIVLEGVEPAAAEAVGPALRRGIDAANRACTGDDAPAPALNMQPEAAQDVARTVGP